MALARREHAQAAAARERVRRRGHRLERDAGVAPRREDLREGVALEELNRDPPPAPRETERRPVADERVAVVEVELAKRAVEPRERELLARRDRARVEGEPAHRREAEPPLRARELRDPQIG